MGNRGGALHGADRTLGSRRWVSRQWICCRLSFRGRRRQVMTPGRYTELFFLDEATALAAGHRPCFECRREDAVRFAELWSKASGRQETARAADIDRELHAERLTGRGAKRLWEADIATLPAGAFILDTDGTTCLLTLEGELRAWSASGYGPPRPRPRNGIVRVLTPPGIIGALSEGYRPILHESARNPG